MATRNGNRAANQPNVETAALLLPSPRAGGSAPLDAHMLKRLYAYMLKCRMVEERTRLLFRQRKLAGCYLDSLGQEAIQVGTTIDLFPEDTVAPARRNLVTGVMRGTPLKFMYARLYARNPGRGPRRDCAPADVMAPSVAAAPPSIGAAVALACKMQNRPNIVVALCESGSASLGLWHEAVESAAAHRLPVVCVIESELRVERSASVPVDGLSLKARTCGVPCITVDTNDVVAVYRVAREAIKRAREGGGPTLIESKAYDVGVAQHRSPKQADREWLDPIPAMEQYLRRKRLWSDDWKRQLAGEISREIEEAIRFAENAACPELEPSPLT
jgi:TPP-dependent pyruvate/acetoin dehydrogenase alpha subunit